MKQIINWFNWIKKTSFVELKELDVSEDPIRPELDLKWRTSFGRKIYGLEYDKKIEEVVQPFFESYYSIEFSNYAVDDSYLHDHEIIATGKA